MPTPGSAKTAILLPCPSVKRPSIALIPVWNFSEIKLRFRADGACAMGDIGEHFPDTDQKYKGIDSKTLLNKSLEITRAEGFRIVNLDCVIICEKFKVNPYKKAIKESISKLLNLEANKVNIKATTPEKMGAIGRCEGIAVHCVISVDERK